MGRGDGRMRHPYENPKVKIGLMLSTQPYALVADTDAPFFIVVTARILKTPQLSSPITLSTFLTPLGGLSGRSYTNIVRVDWGVIEYPGPHPRVPDLVPAAPPWMANQAFSDFEDGADDSRRPKFIELWPRSWPQYLPSLPNLRTHGQFVTIPPRGEGGLSVKLEVPRKIIAAANVKPGERYRVSLTDMYLGTGWFGFGTFEGNRLRYWESPEKRQTIEELEEHYRNMEWDEYAANINEGEGEWEMGEDPDELAFVVEEDGKAGVVEFDVVE